MNEIEIPGFEILEKLGAGGMATVWKARQVSLDRIVAIKVLSSRLAGDPSDVKMFQTEAQSAARLKHPGIIQIYDANAEKGMYYFVMEYVAGYTVGDWVRRKGALSEKDALLVAECVADALEYAWDKERIVHCDIKPDNVIIDSDGTVKVADLGLARTISAMGPESETDMVMGTPAYMSPEQVRGDPDMDCRADIYSLGAMIYHLITGRMLFHGSPEDRLMDQQLTDKVADPLDLNPKLSRGICWLVERMLAKNKEQRQKSWREVKADLARVRRHGLPLGEMIPDGASTVRRSPKRTRSDYARALTGAQDKPVSKVGMGAVVAGAVAIAGLAVFLLVRLGAGVSSGKRPGAVARVTRPPAEEHGEPTADKPRETDQDAREMYEFAKAWAAKNPDKYDEAIAQFQTVRKQTSGTKYGLMAQVAIRELAEAKDEAANRVLKELNEAAARLTAEKKFDEAVGLYETYNGTLAAETEARRAAGVEDLRRLQSSLVQEERNRASLAEQRLAQTLDGAALALAAGDARQAAESVSQAMEDKDLSPVMEKLGRLAKFLQAVLDIDDGVLRSFESQKGGEITVSLNASALAQAGMSAGQQTLVVVDVRNGKVVGERKVIMGGVTATAPVAFGVRDLAVRERLQRMGSQDSAEASLVKGLMALDAGNYSRAEEYFNQTEPMIAVRLVARVKELGRKKLNDDAEKELGGLMKSIGIPVGQFEPDSWLQAVENQRLKSSNPAAILQAVENFRKKHEGSEFVGQANAILNALVGARDADDATARREVAPGGAIGLETLGRESSPGEVVRLLLEANNGLNSEEIRIHAADDGSAVGLEICSAGAADINPVAALPALKSFVYVGNSEENGMLKDISPLRGLALERVLLHNCRVNDIGPLKGMPLKEVNLSRSNIKDLLPLKGAPIESLDLSGTKVYDFSPLSEMRCWFLNLSDTQFKSLSGIKNMPVTHLELRNTKIYDFSPLAGMRLRHLELDGTQIKSIEVLAGLPLESLSLKKTDVSDLAPLRGMPLRRLDVSETRVKDFSMLREMPLRELHVGGTEFDNPAMLDCANLAKLGLEDTAVGDISALIGKGIVYLNIRNTRVTDMNPLRGMPLQELDCRGINAGDFSPLAGLPITTLWIDNPSDYEWLFKSLPQLRNVNGVDVWLAADNQGDTGVHKKKAVRWRVR